MTKYEEYKELADKVKKDMEQHQNNINKFLERKEELEREIRELNEDNKNKPVTYERFQQINEEIKNKRAEVLDIDTFLKQNDNVYFIENSINKVEELYKELREKDLKNILDLINYLNKWFKENEKFIKANAEYRELARVIYMSDPVNSRNTYFLTYDSTKYRPFSLKFERELKNLINLFEDRKDSSTGVF